MKRTFVNITARKFISAAIIATVLTAGTFTAKAGEAKKDASHIEYAGTASNNENVAFNVNYENVTGANFSLTVTNESGEVIFTHLYNEKNFSKKVVIEKLPEDGGNVTFSIKGADTNLKESFNINTATFTTSDVVVTKVK